MWHRRRQRGGAGNTGAPHPHLRGLEYRANLLSLRVLDLAVRRIKHQNNAIFRQKNQKVFCEGAYPPSDKIWDFFGPLLAPHIWKWNYTYENTPSAKFLATPMHTHRRLKVQGVDTSSEMKNMIRTQNNGRLSLLSDLLYVALLFLVMCALLESVDVLQNSGCGCA